MKVGDRVKSQHGYIGIINRQYDDFSACAAECISMTGQEWLAQQEIEYTKENLNERWFGVLCDDGGEIWSCESRLIAL